MISDILQNGEFCPLAGVAFILMWLGYRNTTFRQQMLGKGFAGAAFLGYGAYAMTRVPPADAGELFVLTLRCLVIAGMVLGLAWLTLPLTSGVTDNFVSRLRNVWSDHQYRKQSRRKDEENQRQAAKDRERWEEDAPQREKARREAERLKQQRDQAQQRREDARFDAVVTYTLNRHELGARFNQKRFDDFVSQYMGDNREPEYVEARARELQMLIEKLVRKTAPPQKPTTLAELEAWLREQQLMLEASSLSEPDKKVKQLHLQKHYDTLYTRILHGV